MTACVVTSYGPGLAAIGMMLVAERYARQGVGRRLMQHVVNEAGDIPLTLHATPYGQPLYEQLGFVETGRAEMVRGHLQAAGACPRGKGDHPPGDGRGPSRRSCVSTPRSSASTAPT